MLDEVHGQVSLILTALRVCRLCGVGSMGDHHHDDDEKHLVFECPHLQTIRDKYAGLFGVPTIMVQFFWRDDLVDVDVSKFICECMDVMLGADSDNQSQTSDRPRCTYCTYLLPLSPYPFFSSFYSNSNKSSLLRFPGRSLRESFGLASARTLRGFGCSSGIRPLLLLHF